MSSQTYEDYWVLTLEYTDFNNEKFLKTLKICVNFIDKNANIPYSAEKYKVLQEEVLAEVPKSSSDIKNQLASTRKAINQLVKLGFINTYLNSYNPETLEYLKARTNRKRQSILSKIIYRYASFNCSVSETSNLHQLNFLIKTLVELGKLSREEIIALMLVDIEKVQKGYLDETEIKNYVTKANQINFLERKYNQIQYLINILNKLDDIVFVENTLYFEDDAKNIFGDDFKGEKRIRDPYLHRIYKNQLKDESKTFFGDEKCMVEKLAYPVLIASHIKPFIIAEENEAYDPENGILLSRNLDALFDLGYITFEHSGKITCAKELSDEIKESLKKYTLSKDFLTDKRKNYLDFHKQNVFEKKHQKAKK